MTTPHQHQRRHLARGAGHGEDQPGQHRRAGQRQHHLPQGLGLGRAQCQGALADAAGNPRQPFFGGDDHHRHGEDRQGQRGPQQARGAEGGRGQAGAEEQLVQGAAQHIDEETEAEDAVDDGRHPGEVIDRDADDAGQQTLPGIFAQVDGGDDAEGGDDHRHQQGHHHGAEDGREDAALGVGLARIGAEEFPQLGAVEAELGAQAHGVGLIGAHDAIQIQLQSATLDVAHHHAVAAALLAQAGELLFQLAVACLQLGAAAGEIGLGGGIEAAVQLQGAALQAQALQVMVDAADVVLFQPFQALAQGLGALQPALEFGQGRSAGGDLPSVFAHRHDIAVEVAPATALQHQHLGRGTAILQPVADQPDEVAARQVAVAHLEQFAGQGLASVRRQRQPGAAQPLHGYRFGLHHLTQHQPFRQARRGIARLHHLGRPEVRQATHGDDADQPQGHEHGQGHGAGAEPDAGRAALQPAAQGAPRGGALPLRCPHLRAPHTSSSAAGGSARPGCSSGR
ncbi:hypothetical protein Q3H58_002911 [Pseudomonas psychrotolerans]|nr:hypothetical protein [Pseudomonas psychrotolerans]